MLYWPLSSISPVFWQREDAAHVMQPFSKNTSTSTVVKAELGATTLKIQISPPKPGDGQVEPFQTGQRILKAQLAFTSTSDTTWTLPLPVAALWNQQRLISARMHTERSLQAPAGSGNGEEHNGGKQTFPENVAKLQTHANTRWNDHELEMPPPTTTLHPHPFSSPLWKVLGNKSTQKNVDKISE